VRIESAVLAAVGHVVCVRRRYGKVGAAIDDAVRVTMRAVI
jgi:hypothetical protein